MRKARSVIAILGLAGCPGEAPITPGMPDADVPGDADVMAVTLSGTVFDYFGSVAVEGATVTSDGLDPAVTTTSAADGAYALEVAVGSSLFVIASKSGYRATRSPAVAISDMPVMQNVMLTAEQDITNQYTAAGATKVAGTAVLIAELRRNNNMPLDGIPLTSIELLDSANQPVAGVKGPFAFNAAGSIDPSLTDATTFTGRSRIAYLDVPPGTHTLVVTYPTNGGGTQTNTTTVTTAADGATLALSGGGMGGGGNVTNPTFAGNIHLKLQRAAAGGLGCANCHTLTGSAAFLKFDDPAGTVLANMLARPGVIVTTAPATSLLVVRPLYEAPPAPQDHPNATFLDVNDADYKLFLLWITNGAPP